MSCDRCGECRQDGSRYCRYCGERLVPYPGAGCERCEECRSWGDVFCRYCGKRLIEDEHPLLKIGFVIGLITAIFLTMLLFFEYAVALWGIPQVLPRLPDYGSTLIVVVPMVVDVVSFNGILSQIYYILLILALTASLLTYICRFVGPLGKMIDGDNESVRDTAFYEVCVLFSTLYFWEIIYLIILQSSGVEINPLPEMDTWVWMYELLEASVWEEIITRILMIGFPTVLIAAFMRHEGKGSVRYLIGGIEMNRTAVVLIFFSAFMFGAGHIGGWGWWKFFPTFVFGLIAGYLFCKYGVYATILFHFMTDYISAESWLSGSDASIFTALLIFGLALVCAPFTYVYLKKGVVGLREIITFQSNGLK